MKHTLLIALLAVSTTVGAQSVKSPYQKGYIDFNKNGAMDVFENPNEPIDNRVNNLIKQMTLEEKEGQLLTGLGWHFYERKEGKVLMTDKFREAMGKSPMGSVWGFFRADPWTRKNLVTGLNPSLAPKAANQMQRYIIENTRLGIPMILAEECAHGHMAIGATVFPTSIGQAATFNPELIHRMAQATAYETRRQGAHIGYGPILDLARDPRWSRVEETYGEDPYLIGEMGAAVVTGFQGKNLKSDRNVISTLKHFAAYGWTEGGHNSGRANVGEREMEEHVLPPFRRAVEAGALSVMSSYNEVDGTPCTSSRHLLTDVLKKRWGFEGFVVSDLHSISGLTGHGVAANRREAAKKALEAGIDADLSGVDIKNHVIDLVNKGEMDISVVDEAVRRVLKAKFIVGLFDNPFTAENLTGFPKEHKELAREVARQSVTLLKNNNNILPLKKGAQKIALIGPNADNGYNMLGDYTAPQLEKDIITVRKGMAAKLAQTPSLLSYSKGCAIRDTTSNEMAEALRTAAAADVVVMVMGGSSARDFSSEFEATGAARVSQNSVSDMESGEGYDRSTLDLMGRQMELLKEVKKLGKPMIVVLIKGRPMILNWMEENADAIIDAWYPGMEGGNAIADVIFGDYNPAGRLPISVPRSVGQLPVFYNTKRSANRSNYVEEKGTPLYSFGYGLSYTTFDYANLKITNNKDINHISVSVEAEITNSGNRAGDEVVQLYVRDEVASFTTPVKQLKAFKRIHLKPGEKTKVRFELDKQAFEMYDKEGTFMVEPGKFTITVGPSSIHTPLKETIEL
ncbi:glycoside hydrolase family 3 N-terminal domain-containing protein [Porphyromonadaceae bacterium]